MPLFNVRNHSKGFTLLETLIIFLIIGILSAITLPSFLGMANRAKVNDAVAKVRGALLEAQREAMRKSKSCTVIMTAGSSVTLKNPPEDSNNNGVLDSGEDINSNGLLDTNNCLVTGDRTLPDGVAMATNVVGSPIQMTFSFRGHTVFTIAGSNPNDQTGKIILYKSDGSTSDRKCVAISKSTGILRSGTYSGDINSANNITAGTCKASQSQ